MMICNTSLCPHLQVIRPALFSPAISGDPLEIDIGKPAVRAITIGTIVYTVVSGMNAGMALASVCVCVYDWYRRTTKLCF